MKSNTIIINGDKYLVEMIDSDIISTKQYVAFRNNDVINDMTVDTDIYLAPMDRNIPNIWPSTNTTGIPLMSKILMHFQNLLNMNIIHQIKKEVFLNMIPHGVDIHSADCLMKIYI